MKIILPVKEPAHPTKESDLLTCGVGPLPSKVFLVIFQLSQNVQKYLILTKTNRNGRRYHP